jgi:hypothetical protein
MREVVDDRERSDSSASAQRVVNEVQRPALVHRPHGRRWIATPQRNSTPNAFPDLQICLTVDTSQTLDVDHPPVAPNHHMEAPVAKSPTLCSKFFEALPQRPVVHDSYALISEHSSITFCDLTRAALADRDHLADCPHRSTALRGRQKFPSATILRASI